MRRDTTIQLIAIAVLIGFLGASIALTTKVAASVGRNRLVYADKAEAGDPPQVALGIAMGAFRGVFVNFLWIRANNLKEDGKYFESVDLARTITRLQPRFPKVWAFHAWNLAYNISVATQTPQERWEWVQAGIRLLRGQGIPANPSDLALHKELAWIFLHKVGGIMDDAHVYYKKSLAYEWGVVLGKPPQMPLGNRTPKEASNLFVEKWLRPMAEAAASLDELYSRHPEAKVLVERLTAAGIELDFRFLQRVDHLNSLASAASVVGYKPDVAADPLAQLMSDTSLAEAGKALVLHVRRKLVTDEYHMEPERMIRFTEKFGPLDWRHPAAHALYWAARGVEEAQLRVTEENRRDFDFTNTDRVVVQAIQEMFRTGTLFADTVNPNFYMSLPNPDFLDSYEAYREETVKRAGVFEDETRRFTLYREGLENFYRDAIRYLYRRGDVKRAQQYYDKLRLAPWLNVNNPYKTDDLSVTLAEFVEKEITNDDRITSPSVALQEVTGALESAFLEGLLGGNSALFQSNFEYALMFYEAYQKSQKFKTHITDEQGRMGMPPFDIFSAQILAGLIMAADIPQGPTMFRKAPEDLQARVYVLLEFNGMKERFGEDPSKPTPPLLPGQEAPPGFDTWFPPPASVDVVRKQMRDWVDQNRPDKGNTEEK